MTDTLDQAFLRLRDAADADEYVPTEKVIDTVLARLAAARAEIDRMRAEADTMRHRIAALREALEDVREWAKHDHVMRYDDGDVPLADYCTQAIQGEK